MITNVMQTQVHGVFLKIENTGVLLTGEPGVGKSRAALGLIARGHQLIADDLVEIIKQQQTLIGQCPPLLSKLLKIRGVELFDISNLYGATAIGTRHSLDLIIDLKALSTLDALELDTLEGNYSQRIILGQAITQITLATQLAADLALLIEVIVKNYQLKTHYPSSNDLLDIKRLASCA